MNKVSDWLKVLIKETNVPFLVVGVDGTVRRILDANAQLSRLFAIRETLHPFQWNSREPETIKEFMMFIAFAERMIGIQLTEEIERKELLYRMYYATDGVVGNVMNLLRYGVALAQQREADILTLEILAQAFNMRLAEHVRKKSPFAISDNQPPVMPQPTRSTEAKPSSAQTTQDLSASDVLTTR